MSVGWTYWLMATEWVMATVIGDPFQDEVTKMARLPPCSVSLALCLSAESLLPPDVLSKPTCQETEGSAPPPLWPTASRKLQPSVQQPAKDRVVPIAMPLNLEKLPSFEPSDETAALANT